LSDPPEAAPAPSPRPPRGPPLGRMAIGWLRRVLGRWVDVQVLGADALRATLDRGRPVCWALPFRQLSSLVVLDEQTRRLGLPLPLAPLAAAGDDGSHGAVEPHAFFGLTRRGAPSPLRPRPYPYAPRLQRLVAAVRRDPAFDVLVVPVHVFWGRAPGTQDSIVKALFAEGWAIPGPLRQALRVLIHGRQTLLRFGEPQSLREMIRGVEDDALALRRAARLLRAAYRHERERVVGPDLSHRRTLIRAVVAAGPVQQAIEVAARDRGVPLARAEADARRAAWEIASNYSYPFIRAFDLGLQLLWNRLYDGIESHRLETWREAAGSASVVYVPCHRSHIDYLLLSYLVYQQGLPPPHVAAGANLDLPVVGGILRRGGAFFLRRSFRGDLLYSAVFAEYLHAMIAGGFPVEYFIEGGRSRTGRTLAPRTGLLAMTVESWLRAPDRPLTFLPVYIGYERLIEGDSYVAELSGRPKQKESLRGLLRSIGRLRQRFGRVSVNAGEPIELGAFLQSRGLSVPSADDAVLRDAVAALALAIVTRINDAAVVNPVNLVSMVLLGTPRLAIDATRLVGQLDLLRGLLLRVPHSPRLTVTPLDGAAIVAQAERTGLLIRIVHPLGDVLKVADAHAPLLPYFRNNVLHVWALPALLAALLAQHPDIGRERLAAIVRRVFPFLRADLFLSCEPERLDGELQRCLEAFDALALTGSTPSAPGSDLLQGLAQSMRQPLERYFIVLAVLTGRGSGSLTSASLEELCGLLAQRMAFLHEGAASRLPDRAGFRPIIATLSALGWVHTTDGRLGFDRTLEEAAADADWLLAVPMRQAIGQLTRLSDEAVARAEGAFAVSGGAASR